ncbi:siphovirus ReqiPepy6 Gp37-like family protein [Actinocorallia libanotica]|uniref:Minor tail protein n=1 Tax=Actinocorallia libanotica TaxID=46162 RepID=A0ABP4CH92_9ACTN
MNLLDITVEVRDKNLKRMGQIPPDDLNLQVEDKFNNVGSWELSLPIEHPMTPYLRAPGSGLIVTGPSGVLFSGPTVEPEYAATTADPTGSVTFKGVSDSIILSDMLAWPEPWNVNPHAQGAAYDTRTAGAESLMHAYVNANVGPGAPAERRNSRLIMGANGFRGPSVTKSARFVQLGTLCSEIVAGTSLGFRVIQQGTNLVFETYLGADRTKFIRLDVWNGTLSEQRVAISAPAATHAIVGGDGESENRAFKIVTTADSIAASSSWGRRIETFVDARSNEETTDAELTQAGTEALAEAGKTGVAARGVTVEDVDYPHMQFGKDWHLGDRVTVVVEGQELASIVTGMVLKADEGGLRLGAELGDASGFDPDAVVTKRIQSTEDRVSNLERTVEPSNAAGLILNARDAGGVLQWNQGTPTGNWPEGTSLLYLNATDATAGGWGFGGMWGFVVTHRQPGGGDATQRWTKAHPPGTAHEEWFRGGNASGWGPWNVVPFGNTNVARGIKALQNITASDYIGNNETIIYRTNFQAEANRCYKVTLRAGAMDANATGDGTRVAKTAGFITCRYNEGGAAFIGSPSAGVFQVTAFHENSDTAMGVSCEFFINGPAAGPLHIGISLQANRDAGAYGQVRILAIGTSNLAVEDVGAAI